MSNGRYQQVPMVEIQFPFELTLACSVQASWMHAERTLFAVANQGIDEKSELSHPNFRLKLRNERVLPHLKLMPRN